MVQELRAEIRNAGAHVDENWEKDAFNDPAYGECFRWSCCGELGTGENRVCKMSRCEGMVEGEEDGGSGGKRVKLEVVE